MALPDIDIWRAANLLMTQHGADAEMVAAQRADEMLVERSRADLRIPIVACSTFAGPATRA